jgi:hypothetical protein
VFLGSVLGLFGIPASTAQPIGYVTGGALVVLVGVITGFSFGSLVLFTLFVAHALVGSVELGTDGWIQNITGNLFTSEQGKFLFMWTSLVMFSLRFCADWLERNLKISPVGLLVICALLACVGLNLASGMTTFAMAVVALTIYAVGKTFFWPTMLAVASDRFPRTGAVAISIMGGIGMLAGGMLGGPGLGYCKDRFAAEALQASSPQVYAQNQAQKPSEFLDLGFTAVNAIDGKKLADAKDTPADKRSADQAALVAASIEGDRKTLRVDSLIPATMAVLYLLLLLHFKTKGGYRAVRIDEAA